MKTFLIFSLKKLYDPLEERYSMRVLQKLDIQPHVATEWH